MAGLSDRFVPDAEFDVYWRASRTRLDAELARWIPEFCPRLRSIPFTPSSRTANASAAAWFAW